MKMTFKCDHEDGCVVNFEASDETIYEIIQNFEHFLKGCGFSFSGKLTIDKGE